METLALSAPGHIAHEIARRRTFAIISHPDAGKTTLTEKLLLYAGAIHLAGAVRARKNQRHATSDWMAMEQQRGISITASALEMEYNGFRINLLDTPGHQDFSEDTYRTLMAVDSAVMVLDSAKGIEPQTEKLFQVCRMRGIPILTFINKMDHPGREPLDLLDEIEKMLGISTFPMNWPIGSGREFQGVYDRANRSVLSFERTVGGQHKAPVTVSGLDDPRLAEITGDRALSKLRDEVQLLEGAGGDFDKARFLEGKITPVFFGSALNNFGVELFLNELLALAPPPGSRAADRRTVAPQDETFSGFIFKIQANMDPRHRDRMAFLRVCSGRFEKDMNVLHTRLGRQIRISSAFRIFAREREPIEVAYAGDVIGIVSPGHLAIGDTLTGGEALEFAGIPRFSPEHFGALMSVDFSRYKQFRKGLEQLEEEGAAQVFTSTDAMQREPVLGVIGQLQFDVVLSRMKEEYGVDCTLRRLPYTRALYVAMKNEGAASGSMTVRDGKVGRMVVPSGAALCTNSAGRTAVLFSSAWELEYMAEQNPGVAFSEL